MKFLLKIAALALALGLATAQAQVLEARPFVAIGLTLGGDNLATVQFTNSNTQSLHAGGLVDLKGGVDLRFTPMVSMQLSLGYHSDSVSGSNGSLRFERIPAEVLGHIQVGPQVRLGGGARFTSAVRLSGSGVLGGNDENFRNSVGTVVEGEFFFTRNMAVKLRYVTESFKSETFGDEVNGNHGGVFFSYYFL